MSESIQTYFNEIATSNFRGANMISFQGDLRILAVALKQYNLLFNNLFKTKEQLQAEVAALVAEIPTLAESNRRAKLNSLQSKSNLIANKNEIATATAAANVAKIQEKLNKYSDAIQTLIGALESVQKDVLRMDPKLIFKSGGLMGKSPEKKSEELFALLSNIVLSLKTQKRQFTKLRDELRTAVVTADAKRSASQLQARLNSMRGIVGVPGLSAENQREGLIRALSKIQTKIGGATRKRRHSRRRHTRRN